MSAVDVKYGFMLCFETNPALRNRENFVLCLANIALCLDIIVLCFNNAVLCFDKLLMCLVNTVLCLEKCLLCSRNILLCFKKCLLRLQMWATVFLAIFLDNSLS